MADFAHQHSLVERLLVEGLDRVLLIEWRSASPAMRYLSIDSCLADLGIALEDLGGRANLVGLCQGGWPYHPSFFQAAQSGGGAMRR